MGLFNHFPYPDTHQLNLDWILETVKSCVDMCASYMDDIKSMMGKLYPVGAVYVNYRNQALPVESDAAVIARLEALTGGTWARAGSHGQPVTASDKLGWATVILGNATGDANDTNFNIYVRTA